MLWDCGELFAFDEAPGLAAEETLELFRNPPDRLGDGGARPFLGSGDERPEGLDGARGRGYSRPPTFLPTALLGRFGSIAKPTGSTARITLRVDEDDLRKEDPIEKG